MEIPFQSFKNVNFCVKWQDNLTKYFKLELLSSHLVPCQEEQQEAKYWTERSKQRLNTL